MKKIVVKIGGSNFKSPKDIAAVIEALRNYDLPLVIVVSALYGVTDLLENSLDEIINNRKSVREFTASLESLHSRVVDMYLANSDTFGEVKAAIDERLNQLSRYLHGINLLGELPEFARDMILSYGERIMSCLFTAILKSNGHECRELLPENIGLRTIGGFNNASVDFETCRGKIKKQLSGPDTIVIPGFYGVSAESKIMLFGRGGSDYSAACIARCIDAVSLDVWKDVPGFLSSDPDLVESPLTIGRLSYREAAELSYFGARILHPRCVEPLIDGDIPIRIFNINADKTNITPYTIINSKSYLHPNGIKSVTFTDDIAILQLIGPGVGLQLGIIANIASEFNRVGLNIKSIITTHTAINIMLSKNDLEVGLTIARSSNLPCVRNVSFLDRITLIAAVGEGLQNNPGIMARIYNALSDVNILIASSGASPVSAYFVVNSENKNKVIEAIHEEFFDENNRGYKQ